MNWTPTAVARLLDCKDDDDLLNNFPGMTLANLKRRRLEFAKKSVTASDPGELFEQYNAREVISVSGLPDGTKILVTSDYQIPFVDWKSLKALNTFMSDWQPDIRVYDGDINDCYPISTFSKNPSRKFRLNDEFQLTRNILDEHDEINPQADKYWLDGNHEDRIYRLLMADAPEVFGLKDSNGNELVTIPRILGLEEREFTYLNYRSMLEIEGFLILHGFTSKVNTAKFMYQRFLSSGCVGHTHDLSSYHCTGVNGTHGFYTIGCLCRTDPDWTVDPVPDWQQGFLTAVVYNNKLHPTLHPIYPDGFAAYGEFYERK